MSEETTDLQKDLERFMQLHAIATVSEVLQIPTVDLLKMDGFGYRLLNYITHLKKSV